MPISTTSYNSRDYTCIVGTDAIEGFAEGTGISVTWESDLTSDQAGMNGDVVVSDLNDRRATVTITLLATSASNASLNARAQFGIKGPFELRNVRTGELAVFSEWCWVQAMPQIDIAAEASPRAWVIRLSNAQVRMTPQPPMIPG